MTLIILIITLGSGCKKVEDVDLIVHNAIIYSVDSNFGIYESFAIRNGKFIEIGKSDDIIKKYKTDKLIDLEGKYVYPGFIDAHCHFYSYGAGLRKANLVGTTSFDEVLKVIQDHYEQHYSGWILGRGWDQTKWEIKEFPDRKGLDSIFPKNPVLLIRVDGHAALINSKAIELAEFTPTNILVKEGKIEVKNDELTGIILDDAIESVRKVIPKPNKKQKIEDLLKAQKACFAVGLTTVSDAWSTYDIVKLVDSLQKIGLIKMRYYGMLEPSEKNIEHFINNGPYKTENLNIRAIKLFADGALGSRGACLLNPYSDTNLYGFIIEDEKYYQELCRLAYDNHYQVCTHAIGDSANRYILRIYSEILKNGNNKRWRVEHAQVINEDDFITFKQFNIIPSIQATHATSDMYWAEKRLGPERVKNAYAYGKLLKMNGWLPNGSDFPVESINPLFGFYAAFSRKDQKGFPDKGFQIENALSRNEALKAMTIWAAKANFEENEKGSIEVGKLADFIVIDKDIITINEAETYKAKVLRTFIGGKEVYSK